MSYRINHHTNYKKVRAHRCLRACVYFFNGLWYSERKKNKNKYDIWYTTKCCYCSHYLHLCVMSLVTFFRRSFETEQRKIYRGHDVLKNPVPKSCKLEDEMYRPPHEPMEAETCNRVGFCIHNFCRKLNSCQLITFIFVCSSCILYLSQRRHFSPWCQW